MKVYPSPPPTGACLIEHAITPAVFTAGDDISVKFLLRNSTGTRLSLYCLQLGFMENGMFTALLDLGSGVVDMENNAEGVFQHDIHAVGDALDAFVDVLRESGERACSGFTLALTLTDNRWHSITEYYPADESCVIFDRHYGPEVPELSLTRRADDKMAFSGRIASALPAPAGLFVCRLYFSPDHDPDCNDEYVDLTEHIDALTAGIDADATIVADTFGEGFDCHFRLEYGDEYEQASRSFVVPQVFANVHESGCETGGVRFGGHSRSMPGNPLFESDYPGYFYGGLANIQSGEVPATDMTGAGNCADIPVDFEQPFADGTIPAVVVGFVSSSTAGCFGRCCAAVLAGSVTNRGFTLRFYNGDNVSRSPAFSYIAVGVPAVRVNKERRD